MPNSDSDSLYHRLFSHPPMVEELVREFVPEALAGGLDFSRLQRVNSKFHGGRRSARRREGDVIWRLPTRGGSDVYLLLEFQCKSDWWMAVRTQVYQGLLWQQVVTEKELKTGASLPQLLLVVLYNGVSRWKAVTNTCELIAPSPDSALWPWQPQVRYYLLDMGTVPRDKLARRTNLAALLFRLEQRPSFEELEELVDEVTAWLDQHPDCAELGRLFAELVYRAQVRLGANRPIPENSNGVEELLMFKSNLEGLDKIWKRQYRAQGKAEGLALGKAVGEAKGLIKGKAYALNCLLVERFGALTPSLQKRINKAKPATLERWFKRAIVAPDLPSVFARS